VSRTFRPPISVFLAHPVEKVRRRLGDEIAGTGITVIGESGNGREALASILDRAPDVALLATELPEQSGPEVCAAVLAELPVCRVLLLADSDDELAFEGFAAGALGCYLVTHPPMPLVNAIRGTMRRESLPTKGWASRILEQYAELTRLEGERLVPPPKLTAAESDVLNRLASGETPPVIAANEGITSHMARVHAGYAMIKLARALDDEQLMRSVR
jgi:DNA-binding NarL/FixJ family response regulator